VTIANEIMMGQHDTELAEIAEAVRGRNAVNRQIKKITKKVCDVKNNLTFSSRQKARQYCRNIVS
jgi:predicted DNA-binding protein YlxM (UPF0122 family)